MLKKMLTGVTNRGRTSRLRKAKKVDKVRSGKSSNESWYNVQMLGLPGQVVVQLFRIGNVDFYDERFTFLYLCILIFEF
jgi:hypothetical protein